MKLDVVRAVVTGAAGGLGRVFCRFSAFDFASSHIDHIDIEV